MGGIHRTKATLGFWHDDLDPDEITAALGRTPTVGVRKGGTWTTSRGAEKIAPTGSWRVKSDNLSPGDLDRQIMELLARLSDDLAVWNHLSRRFGGRFFCAVWMKDDNEGLLLEPQTIAAMASRGLYLDLDIYAPEED
jgi:hypothetical protein